MVRLNRRMSSDRQCRICQCGMNRHPVFLPRHDRGAHLIPAWAHANPGRARNHACWEMHRRILQLAVLGESGSMAAGGDPIRNEGFRGNLRVGQEASQRTRGRPFRHTSCIDQCFPWTYSVCFCLCICPRTRCFEETPLDNQKANTPKAMSPSSLLVGLGSPRTRR